MKDWKEVTVKEFIKEKERMCKKVCCNECSLLDYECNLIDSQLIVKMTVDVVMKWAEENPIVTNLDKLLEIFPNTKMAKLHPNIPLEVQPYDLGLTNKKAVMIDELEEIWGREYKEVTK